MSALAIIDSGGANIASLRYAFERLGVVAELTADAGEIRAADRVILPGVGAAKDAMTRLSNARLIDVIKELTQPVLGICLGMQLLCERSEEENVDCIGVIPGVVQKLPAAPDCPVPNMGWCATQGISQNRLMNDIRDNSYFYYLHSYALPVSEHTLATAQHAESYSAVVGNGNFFAVQFHPERSSSAGAQLLRNFLEIPR